MYFSLGTSKLEEKWLVVHIPNFYMERVSAVILDIYLTMARLYFTT